MSVNRPRRGVTAPLPDQIVLDTCVLISSVLRPLFLSLADRAAFSPVWSDTIGLEWRRTAAHLWGLTPEQIAVQWQVLQQAHPRADVGDVRAFSTGLSLSDPKDWHVIAAGRAVLSRKPASRVAILTRNIRDFHRVELRRLGLQLFDPDQYLTRLWQSGAEALQPCLETLPERARVAGRPTESLGELLHRERLFRLRRLVLPQ